MSSEPKHHRHHGDDCLVVRCSLLVTGRYSPPLFQTQNAALHHVSLGVHGPDELDGATTPTALARSLLALVAALGDHVGDPPPPQHLPTARIRVALVAQQTTGTLARTPLAYAGNRDGIEGGFHIPTVAFLAFRQYQGQRPRLAVGDQVDLGRQPAPTPSECLEIDARRP